MKSRQCFNCTRLFETADGPLSCLAFPDGIPEAIITGEVDHSVPFEGDHGIQYEAKETEND